MNPPPSKAGVPLGESSSSKKTRTRRGTAPNAAEDLVSPAREPAAREHPTPTEALRGPTQSLDQLGTEAVPAKLADSTRKLYASAMGAVQAPFFLTGDGCATRAKDEQRLIRFSVFLHQIMKRSISGIRQRLSAIRYTHIAAGFPDPLQGKPR